MDDANAMTSETAEFCPKCGRQWNGFDCDWCDGNRTNTGPEEIVDMRTGAKALFQYLPVVPFGEPIPHDRENALDIVRATFVSPEGDSFQRDIPYEMWRRLVKRLERAAEADRVRE